MIVPFKGAVRGDIQFNKPSAHAAAVIKDQIVQFLKRKFLCCRSLLLRFGIFLGERGEGTCCQCCAKKRSD